LQAHERAAWAPAEGSAEAGACCWRSSERVCLTKGPVALCEIRDRGETMSVNVEVKGVLKGYSGTGSLWRATPSLWEAAMSAMPAGALPFLDVAALPTRRAAAGLPAARDTLAD